MSRTNGWDRQDLTSDPLFRPQQSSATSRITNFSPFRRAHTQSSSNASKSDALLTGGGSMYKGGLGDVSEVPSMPKAPVKPPKPAGLRVKKAKALSISLLTGGGGGGGGGNNSSHDLLSAVGSSTSTTEKRRSRLLSNATAQSKQQFASAEDIVTLPSRAQTAMDHYKEHGPTKGLASRDWSELDGTGTGLGSLSKKKKLSDWENGRDYGKDESEELFIIGKGQQDVPASSATPSRQSPSLSEPLSPGVKSSKPSYEYRKGGLRGARPDIQTTSQEVYQDPKLAKTYDMDVTAGRRPSLDDLRSRSSAGTSDTNKLQPHSASGSTATPFLNTYTAKAQMGNPDPQSPTKKKLTPTPLGKNAIVRSSYLSTLDNGPSSAPLFSAPLSPSLDGRPRHGHNRTSSAAAESQLSSSLLPPPRAEPRIRTLSGLSPKKTTNPSLTTNALEGIEQYKSPQPPPRHKYSKAAVVTDAFLRVPRNEEDNLHPRSSSPFGQNGALQSLGHQLGGMGVAVGKKGWDLMKNWNSGTSQPNSPLSPTAPRGAIALNDATRAWIAFPDPTSSGGARGLTMDGAGTVFGCSLREAVIKTRLARNSGKMSGNGTQISALDLGSEFSINLPDLNPEGWNSQEDRKAVNRMEARRQYLPLVVVRCIQAIEKWGVEEEGIYRLSGRSSHTAKLKVIFDSARPVTDLELKDIGPAELDLNSVCSLLKAYLRSLPELLLTTALSKDFNQSVQEVCGMSAVGEMTNINHNRERMIREQHEKDSNVVTPPSSPGLLSQRIAHAIKPLMSKLPSVNWYLLREIAYHLGDLTSEESVRQTKMPLSNLCLVLAPTLSLSVAMVRVLVESRDQLFEDTCPMPDPELDNIIPETKNSSNSKPVVPSSRRRMELNRPAIPIRNYANAESRGQSSGPRLDTQLPSVKLGMMDDDDWETKRISVATVRAGSDADKRKSTSSITTLQERNRFAAAASSTSTTRTSRDALRPRIGHSNMRPTSDIFALSGNYSNSGMPIPVVSTESNEEEEEEMDTPPIAAQFIRQRSSSNANSIASFQSSDFSSNVLVKMSKVPSSNSLYSTALQGGTMDSSVTSLPDHDSPKTTDDEHWQNSAPQKPNFGGSIKSSVSSSSTSLNNISSKGTLDRPRPPTSNSNRFFSSRSNSSGNTSKSKQGLEAKTSSSCINTTNSTNTSTSTSTNAINTTNTTNSNENNKRGIASVEQSPHLSPSIPSSQTQARFPLQLRSHSENGSGGGDDKLQAVEGMERGELMEGATVYVDQVRRMWESVHGRG